VSLTTRCVDCGARTKGSRCATCSVATQDDWAVRRKIRSGWKWGKLRTAVRARDRVCVRCGNGDRLEVHHLTPLAQGGTNALRNLEPLCAACHDVAHVATPAEAILPSRPVIA
jgi:5-methylcytosine-specific restriction endonuclease McrA